MEGRGWDARKIINHGLGFHKAPFKLCTVHRLLPGSPSRLWRRKYTGSGGLLFPTSASPSILRIKTLISARENNLAGLLCENSTSPTTPSSLSNYTAWTLSKLVDWWRFVWTDGKPLNYIRGQDFLVSIVISKLADDDFLPSNIQISTSFLLFVGRSLLRGKFSFSFSSRRYILFRSLRCYVLDWCTIRHTSVSHVFISFRERLGRRTE